MLPYPSAGLAKGSEGYKPNYLSILEVFVEGSPTPKYFKDLTFQEIIRLMFDTGISDRDKLRITYNNARKRKLQEVRETQVAGEVREKTESLKKKK